MAFPTPSLPRSGEKHDIEFSSIAPLTARGDRRGMSHDDVAPALEIVA